VEHQGGPRRVLSPKFPRLLKQDTLKETISRGLENGLLAYVGKAPHGSYKPFVYKKSMAPSDVELSDDVFIISKELAEAYVTRGSSAPPPLPPGGTGESGRPPAGDASAGGPPATAGPTPGGQAPGHDTTPPTEVPGFTWAGEVSPQKWMNFSTKGAVEVRDGGWPPPDRDRRRRAAGRHRVVEARGDAQRAPRAGASTST
jgi:hypothetical protein